MSKSKKTAVIICVILTVIFLGAAVASAVPTKKPTDDTPTVDVPIFTPGTEDDNTATPDTDDNTPVENIPVIFSNNVASNALTSIYRYRENLNDGTNSGAAKADTISPVIVSSADLPTQSKDGDVIDNSGIESAICLQEVKTQRALYANMQYTADEIKALALNEDGSYKYQIQITYLINAPRKASIGSGWTTQGTAGAVEARNTDDYGVWTTKTYDVEFFTSNFMGYSYYWDNGEYVYSVYGYTEDETVFDSMVFLNYGLTASDTVDFFLADISFVAVP